MGGAMAVTTRFAVVVIWANTEIARAILCSAAHLVPTKELESLAKTDPAAQSPDLAPY
jgi:hypothetical protein